MPDPDFDPDDNFADGHDGDAEFGDEDTLEQLVWQFLLLINPGDEELALRQFSSYRDLLADSDGEDAEPAWLLKDVVDWQSGFHVAAGDTAGFTDAVIELATRWNLRIDWGVEDPTDAEFLAATDVPALMSTAYDRLREYGYTLWTWNTAGQHDAETYTGWITLSRDDEAMRALAPELGIELRAGSDAS